jgi:hypothetical protein
MFVEAAVKQFCVVASRCVRQRISRYDVGSELDAVLWMKTLRSGRPLCPPLRGGFVSLGASANIDRLSFRTSGE